MRFHGLSLAALGALLLAASPGVRADETVLSVRGAAGEPLHLTLGEIRALPAQRVHAAPEHRAAGDYDCATVASVLARAGVELGHSLRGKRMAEYLLVRAADQYEVAVALPELDAEFTDKPMLLCYLKDGAPLAADEGPLRLVAPGDKRQARWVRQVTELLVERK